MENLDFLFIYEHKVRELENLCLMKYELDKRGYKTEIIYINDAQNALFPKIIYNTKVLCMMACYHNKTLRWHVKDFVRFEKIIDLQWENIVYPKDEKREDAYKNYIEIGKEVVRVSWGKQNQKRLLEVAHMDDKKVKLIGHVGMDFLREPLCKYYLSREELFRTYRIPCDKKVILFASPYYGDSLSQEYIADMCARFGENWSDYYKFMCDSQKIVLQWIKQICEEDSDMYFIFRPHPGHPSTMALELEKKYANFRVIGDKSVKQWIVACDRVYTGNSSVVVEAFFAKKMCQLLFPLPTTDGFELEMITHSNKISDFDQFKSSLYSDNEEFPTPLSSIEEIYIVDWKTPSYIRFADMAEEVFRDDYFKLSKQQLKSYKNYSFMTKIQKNICKIDFVYKFYLKMIQNEKLQWSLLNRQRALRQRVYDLEQSEKHELTNQEEIQSIITKIKNAIEA